MIILLYWNRVLIYKFLRIIKITDKILKSHPWTVLVVNIVLYYDMFPLVILLFCIRWVKITKLTTLCFMVECGATSAAITMGRHGDAGMYVDIVPWCLGALWHCMWFIDNSTTQGGIVLR